jgi:ATP-dependent DNA helicase DinG
LRLGSTGKWLEQFAGIMQRIAQGQQPGKLQALLGEAVVLSHALRASQLDVFAVLKQFRDKAETTNGRGDVSQYVFLRGVVEEGLCDMLRALSHDFNELAGRLGKVADILKECMEIDGGELDRQQAEVWFPLFGSAHMRALSAMGCCLQFALQDERGIAPNARWLTFYENTADMDIMLSASPVLAAAALEERLWDECFAAVLTSATLTALDSFDFLQKRCGLPESSSYHRIASPFTYFEAAKLRVPRTGFDPSNNAAHTQAIADLLPKLLTEKAGALVLFSSRRQMLDVLGLLPSAFRAQVLCQDDFTKQELLRLHRETVDRKQTSVIFGLASLAEGIDLPGDYCTHVVIAKIPFPVPTDPVDATLGEWVKEQGRNPFQEISIPEAALRLIQASGRLLRQESDTGTITILDERLVTKFYGKAILDSLPPYEREIF